MVGVGWITTLQKHVRYAAELGQSMKNKLYVTDKLREYRIKKKYTQDEMRTLFKISCGEDVSFSTFQKWEQGILNITPEFALELSRFTHIQLEELVERR